MTRIKKYVIVFIVMCLSFIPSQVLAYQLVILGPSNEVIKYKEGKTVEGDTALSVLKKAGVSYVDEGDKYPQYEGSYVTSIAGIGMDKSQGWIFTVNGNYINHSASTTPIYGDDRIVWCAYANQENQNSFEWPALNKQEKVEHEINNGTNRTIDIDKIISDVTNKEEVSNDGSDEQNSEVPEKEEYDVNSVVQNILDSERIQKPSTETIDYRNLGYVGIILVFILGISFIKLLRKGNEDEK